MAANLVNESVESVDMINDHWKMPEDRQGYQTDIIMSVRENTLMFVWYP